jgi:hypothetical protein
VPSIIPFRALTDTLAVSASRSGTDTYLQSAIQGFYPDASVTVTQDYRFRLLEYAHSGEVMLRPLEGFDAIQRTVYAAPRRRRDGNGGTYEVAVFAGYEVAFRDQEFKAIVAEVRDKPRRG